MGRNFVSASTQWLFVNASPITAMPLTICAWARARATATNGCVVQVSDKDVTRTYFELQFRSDFKVRAALDDGTTAASAVGVVATAIDTWTHCAAVFASATSRTSYINGANPVNETTNVAGSFAGMDRVSVARRGSSGGSLQFNGDVAEVAIWNVALTEPELLALANGTNPKLIRPENLVFYAPLYGVDSPEPNLTIGGSTYNLTLTNTPTLTTHPPVSPHLF